MAQQVADRRDVDFVLHEQFEAETLQQYSDYGEFNKKTIDMVIGETVEAHGGGPRRDHGDDHPQPDPQIGPPRV